MILQITFPDNLVTGLLAEQKNIPCVIKVAGKFEVVFTTVIPFVVGIMHEWDRQLLEERAIARAGGAYTHNDPALITLKKREDGKYDVVNLSVFYNDFGWFPVVKDRKYAAPIKFWDSDEEDPGYDPPKL